jgi:hypothetical protein
VSSREEKYSLEKEYPLEKGSILQGRAVTLREGKYPLEKGSIN